MSRAHWLSRIEWATFYGDLDWTRAIFADESCFTTEKDGIKYVKRTIGKRYSPEYVNYSDRPHRKLISTFGFINKSGSGDLVRFDSRLSGQVYAELLDTAVIDYVKHNFGSSTCYYIEDNCPAHRHQLVNSWFLDCNALHGTDLHRVNLPAYSPELNVIENVWGFAKSELLYIPEAESRNELWIKINETWRNIMCKANYIDDLITSMNVRCDTVFRNDG